MRQSTVRMILSLVLVLLVAAACYPVGWYDDGLGQAGPGVGTRAVDPNILCYRAQGGDQFVCRSGGEIEMESGSTLDVNGTIDLDPTAFDIDTTAGFSIDGDLASNVSTSVGDLTLEAETGSVIVKGDEAVADAVYIDANDAVTTGVTIAVGSVSGLTVTGGLTDIGEGTGGTADGNDDLLVAGDAEVDDTLDVDGDIDLDGDGFDVNITGGVSIDADTASNFSAAAGDITIEAETGSLVLKADEAVADAVYIDANQAVTTGVTTVIGASGAFKIDGGLTNIGTGTYATADGDNDLGVAGDLEVDGAIDADGTLVLAGTATMAADVTVSADATGGNALAVNEFIGVPRIDMVGIGTMANGTTNTVITDIGDSETPATDWTAIDADTVMTNDSSIYRQGTASLKMAIATTADATDGCINALGSGDQNWTDDEGFGFWFYADRTLTAGDLVLVITDGGAGDTSFNLPAYGTANVWQWMEIDVTVANASKDVLTDISFELSAAGAAVAVGGAFNVYFDFIVKWDVAEEETLGHAILQDGVMSVLAIDGSDGGATSATLVEYTDYFVHYQSGNDAVVMITDQSNADRVGVALVAY